MIIHHYHGLILYSEYKHIMTRFGSIQDKNGAQFLALKMRDFLDTLHSLSRKMVIDNVSNWTLLDKLRIFANKILFFICFNLPLLLLVSCLKNVIFDGNTYSLKLLLRFRFPIFLRQSVGNTNLELISLKVKWLLGRFLRYFPAPFLILFQCHA